MRPKRPVNKAVELTLTDRTVGFRHVIYVDGYPALVTDSCLLTLRMLAKAILDGSNNGYVPGTQINAKMSNVRCYIYRWEKDVGVLDSRLKGTQLFENDHRGNWRLVVSRDGIKFECLPGNVPVL